MISLFPLPRPPENAPYRNFCEKGGRFGPHNQHQWQYQDVLLHDENLTFLTYFNAGLRVFDISDERLPAKSHISCRRIRANAWHAAEEQARRPDGRCRR